MTATAKPQPVELVALVINAKFERVQVRKTFRSNAAANAWIDAQQYHGRLDSVLARSA